MIRSVTAFLFFVAGLTGVLGCAESRETKIQESAERRLQNHAVESESFFHADVEERLVSDEDELAGGYEARLAKTESQARRTEPCDWQGYEQRLEIARGLDAWTARTEKHFAGPWVRVGPLKLRKRMEEASTLDWEEEEYDWPRTYALWQKTRDSDDSDARWKRLRKRVVRLLNSDYRRRVDEVDLSLDRHHVDAGQDLYAMLGTCTPDSIEIADCPTFEEAAVTRFLLGENESFRALFEGWKDAGSREDRLHAFDEISAFADFLVDYYFPRKTNGIRWKGQVLSASVRPGDFAGYEDELASVIEKFWNRLNERLRLRWVDSANDSPFVFRFLDRPGEPSKVDRRRRTVHLANEAREASPAHEFGHVLGFRDRYFKVWRPRHCGYVYQFRSGDLMSEVSAGVVHPGHWQALRSVYE
jgi:hypothetical protein